MKEINIKSLNKIYRVLIGSVSELYLYGNFNRKVLIVSDKNVDKDFVKKIASFCKDVYYFSYEFCEKSKTIDTALKIIDILFQKNFTRSDLLLCIGGGVATDITGFVSSIYKRGIEYYSIPTTVLSQLDSSIGGKTGVNYKNTKNIIGTFYPPSVVLIDKDTLKTLSKRQISNGLLEALKMGILFNRELFDLIYNCDPFEHLDIIIEKCIRIKKEIVEKDENDLSLRKLLNYGHTVGHAIEVLSNGELYHGECIGYGMICFSSLKIRKIIKDCLLKLSIPPLVNYNNDELVAFIKSDKKSIKDKISCVTVIDINKYKIEDFTLKQIKERLKYLKEEVL